MTEVTFIGAGALIERAVNAAYTACVQADEDLVARQMAAAPVKTGTLRAGIHIASIDRGAMSVTATNETGGESNAYAVFVHEGTGAHIIHGNPWLVWPGADHPVREVHHPGTAPNPFMRNPLIENIALYERAAATAMAGEF